MNCDKCGKARDEQTELFQVKYHQKRLWLCKDCFLERAMLVRQEGPFAIMDHYRPLEG